MRLTCMLDEASQGGCAHAYGSLPVRMCIDGHSILTTHQVCIQMMTFSVATDAGKDSVTSDLASSGLSDSGPVFNRLQCAALSLRRKARAS